MLRPTRLCSSLQERMAEHMCSCISRKEDSRALLLLLVSCEGRLRALSSPPFLTSGSQRAKLPSPLSRGGSQRKHSLPLNIYIILVGHKPRLIALFPRPCRFLRLPRKRTQRTLRPPPPFSRREGDGEAHPSL